MGSAAYAYDIRPVSLPAPERRHDRSARPTIVVRAAPSPRVKLPLYLRVAIILGGALIGWAVPIACAVTLS